MYCADPALAPLLEGMEDTAVAAASMQGAFSLAALAALSGGGGSSGSDGATAAGGQLPPAEELVAGLAAAKSGDCVSGQKSGARLPSPSNDSARRPSSGSPPRAPGTPGNDDVAAARDQGNGATGLGRLSSPTRLLPRMDSAASPGSAGGAALARAASASGGAAGVLGASGALARAGSGGLARAGSLSSKKASPNRVCCNALLASYARAAPAQWGRALALLRGMWACGGELTPDIVR